MSTPVLDPVGMTPATPWTEVEMRSWRDFLEMHHRLERHLNQHIARDFGLSGADFEILVNVSEAPGGRIPVTDLTRATQWEKSRMSHQLRRMAERGLLTRDTRQRRRHEVELTDAGWRAIRAAAPANAERIRELFVDVLGPQRLAAVGEASRAVREAIDSHLDTDCSIAEAAQAE